MLLSGRYNATKVERLAQDNTSNTFFDSSTSFPSVWVIRKQKESITSIWLKMGNSSEQDNSKLTGSGLTLVGSDFVGILEEVLPQKYGGGATDYQLLEEEDNRGQTHLSLIISPTVGEVDDSDVIATVLSKLQITKQYREL